MFEKLNLAINNNNYTEAKKILTQLKVTNDNNLWCKYYQSLILEKEENWQEAEAHYREILKDSIYPDPKLIKLIRDGIERIININQKIKQKKINQFKNIEDSDNLAVLFLEPVSLEEKKILAPKLAKILNIDNYTATLQIPTRSWRLYKTGILGELNYFQSEFSQVNIPCFCHSINNINQLQVYQVKYIISDEDKITLMTENETEKDKEIIVNWEEINNKVQGLIPIFELILHLDARGESLKKKSILDYAQCYDLHLTRQNLILRFSDNFYKFDQGLNVINRGKTSQ